VAGCFVQVGIALVGIVQREDSFRKQQQQVQGKCSNHRMLAYRTACCRTAGNLRLHLAVYHRSCTAGGRPEQRGEVLGGRNLAPLGRQWLGGAVQQELALERVWRTPEMRVLQLQEELLPPKIGQLVGGIEEGLVWPVELC